MPRLVLSQALSLRPCYALHHFRAPRQLLLRSARTDLDGSLDRVALHCAIELVPRKVVARLS
jgi:hypothetical protein